MVNNGKMLAVKIDSFDLEDFLKFGLVKLW